MFHRIVPLALALSIASSGCGLTFGTIVAAITPDPPAHTKPKDDPVRTGFLFGLAAGLLIDVFVLVPVAHSIGCSDEC